MAFRTTSKAALILGAAIALGAACVRFRGIFWGWPGVFDADAPHIVNLAVYFGSGDLNPHIFKYPTLWPYLLSALYGAYFAAGLAAGAWASVSQFGAHFVWHTADFHVLARFAAAAVSLLGVWAVWRAGREAGPEGLWAAALAAFTPVLAEMAHTPKADSILFLFSALAWHGALVLRRAKTFRNACLCGLWIGLAMSSQYTAAPLALLPVCACFVAVGGEVAPVRPGRRWLLVLASAAAALAAVFATSPYIFLARGEFLSSMADMSRELELVRLAHPRPQVLKALSFNIVFYAGAGSLAFAALVYGFARRLRDDTGLALLLALPCLAHCAVLANHPYGGWARFLIPVFPAFMLLSAAGLKALHEKKPGLASGAVLAALVLGPGIWRSFALAGDFARPDTRLEAARWIEANVASGAAVLLDQEHDSPQLAMDKGQALELFARTSESGHPKRKYYELMASSHPGGGYKIYRIERSAADLESRPAHVRWSNSARDVLDVRPGLGALKAARIEVVVLSSHGINPERRPEYAAFVNELRGRWRRAAQFEPGVKGRGPVLEIYVVK